MKLHQIINSYTARRGGAERIARRLHQGYLAAGLEAQIVAIEAGEPGDELERATSFGLSTPYGLRAFSKLCAYAEREIGPDDIVHVHLFPSSAYVAALKKLGVIDAPCFFTEHSTSNRRRLSSFGGVVDRAVYASFDRIVAISEGTRDELVAAYPSVAGRAHVIWNGAELPFSSPPQRSASSMVRLLSVGRLSAVKNISSVLEAMARLPQGALLYTVVGEGDQRGHLEKQACELGVADSVKFVGFSSDVGSHLMNADIFVIPSLWEGFGLAAVEAMSAGLPVVASDVPGLREVVGANGTCGVLVDPRDPAKIASAIAGLAASEQKRLELGMNAARRAQNFGEERMLDEYVALVGSIHDEHLQHAA